MVAIIIALVLILLNHSLKIYFKYDAMIVDICIGIGYLMYLLL